MRRFLVKLIAFFIGLSGLLFGACFLLPNPDARKTMLGAQIDKINKLKSIEGAKVVIVGGSGAGQGFITSNLCAALNKPVYNMGLHAGLGIIYQMKSIKPYVGKGDLVLLIPEYENFNGVACYGDEEVLMMVIDVIPEHRHLISYEHWLHLIPKIPKYGADKIRHLFMPMDNRDESKRYDEFGDRIYPKNVASDACVDFPIGATASTYDISEMRKVFLQLHEFVATLKEQGAEVVLLPPACQASSYANCSQSIDIISDELTTFGLPFLISPRRYALDDKLFYDTAYHLNLIGRSLRTSMVIEDLMSVYSRRTN